MRRALIAVAALAVIVVAVLVGVRSVGPGTRAAPEDRLYVAISRNEDETDAREIEAIDLASGERTLFDVGARITALTLSSDRRTLFVAVDDGRVLLLDPNDGVTFGEIRTRRALWLVAVPGRSEVVALSHDGATATVARLAVAGRREEASATLPDAAPGRPAFRRDELLVPLWSRGANALARFEGQALDRVQRAQVARLAGRLQLGVPQVQVTPNGEAVYLAQWDSSPAAVRLLTGVAAEAPARETLLAVAGPAPDRPLRGLLQVQASLASAGDGTLHVCVGNAATATRYVVGTAAQVVGSECGQLTRAGEGMYLALRGKPRVAVIEATSGRILRELLLPGIPVLVAG